MLQTRSALTVVVPIYNEDGCIPELVNRLAALHDRMHERVELDVLFVDDGSSDGSAAQLLEAARERRYFGILKLSRNFGHQIAITAGIDHARGDYVCVIDGDLQDPPELIEAMYEQARRTGANVVYGQRRQRKGETFFKRLSAGLFYRILRWMTRIEIPADTGDFRLIDRKVADALRGMREQGRFIRGMVPWAGYRSEPLLYDRDPRYAGVTKYPLYKMLRLAAHGILSFSTKPLRLMSYVGAAIVLASLMGLAGMIYLKLFTDVVVPGITVVLTAIILLNGFTILMIGVMGEYVGRIFEEVKRRPLYFVDVLQPGEGGAPAEPPTPPR